MTTNPNLSAAALDALTILARMGDRGAVSLSHNSMPSPGSRGRGEACIVSSSGAALARKGLATSAPRFPAGHRFADSTQRRHVITPAGLAALDAAGVEFEPVVVEEEVAR